MISNSNLLTRRKAIQGAVALLGGTVVATELGPLIRSVSAMDSKSSPMFLNVEQYSMVERIADLIIPETDTAGARSAGVHRFIDMMLAEWASPATQVRYVEGFERIDKLAADSGASGFSAMPSSRQFEILEKLDSRSYAEDSSSDIPELAFYRELKAFVLFGYYSSEEGASVELKFDRIPGPYGDCVPYDEIGRAWST